MLAAKVKTPAAASNEQKFLRKPLSRRLHLRIGYELDTAKQDIDFID